MKLKLTLCTLTAALALAACDHAGEKSDGPKMGDAGRGSTKEGTAGGGTLSTASTHSAENSDGSSPASQGTTGSATVLTTDPGTSAAK